MPSSACQSCRTHLFNPTSFPHLLISEDDYDALENGGVYITTSKSELQPSNQSGCGFCKLLLHLLTNTSTAPTQPITFRIFAISLSNQPGEISTLYISTELVGSTGFSVFAESDGPAGKCITARRPQWSLDSAETFEVVKNWMRMCDEEHELCRRLAIPAMPTRVLDVTALPNDQIKIKLVETKGILEPYATLSYCWGAAQPAQLIVKNYDSYINEIDITTLPESIQDAIRVTREIGLKYLWVDSLCILQDSGADQAKEISRMGGIYKDSALTIMAASALKCTDGFLHRGAVDIEEWSIPWIGPVGEEGFICLRPSSSYSYDPEMDPVNNRAWIYQERLLSTRLLVYPLAPHPVQWSCPTRLASNGGTVPELEQTGLERLPIFEKRSKPPTDEDQIRLWNLWGSVVKNYTSRNLTENSDKLPAISGIAQQFQDVWGGEYHAGLWSHHLIRGLMWRRFAAKPEDRLSGDMRAYTAPTWSWASRTDRIIQTLTKSPILTDHRFKIRSISANPAVPDVPFGEIRAGELQVAGCLKQAKWNVRARQISGLKDDGQGAQVGTGEPDEDTWGPGVKLDVTCLLVLSPEKYERWIPSGLVLRKAEKIKKDGIFERVGIFVLTNRSWFEDSVEQELAIV